MDDTTLLDFEQDTFERCTHDAENPFAQVSKKLIRDPTISPDCRWLLIYLLSNKDGWKISLQQIQNHLKGFWGRDKVRNIVKEGISAGYINRKILKNGSITKNGKVYKNLKRYVLVVSEYPKFKKSFRHTDFQYTGFQAPENSRLNDNIDSLDNIESLDKGNYVSDQDTTSDNVRLVTSDPAVGHITDYFFNQLKEMHPKIKTPKFESWRKQMHYLLHTDKRSEEEVKEVINYIAYQHKNPKKDFTWSQAVQSPNKLREHFSAIWSEIHKQKPETPYEEKIEVFSGVFLSAYQKEMVLKKCDGNAQLAEKSYEKLSNWKIGKGIVGGVNDYKNLVEWVITAVKNETINVSNASVDKKFKYNPSSPSFLAKHHGLQQDHRPRDPSKTIDFSDL